MNTSNAGVCVETWEEVAQTFNELGWKEGRMEKKKKNTGMKAFLAVIIRIKLKWRRGGFTVWLNTSQTDTRRQKGASQQSSSRTFIGPLNPPLPIQTKTRITPSPSVLLQQIFNFWTSTDGLHICVTLGECWFTHQDEYQVSVCTYGNYHGRCISFCLSHRTLFLGLCTSVSASRGCTSSVTTCKLVQYPTRRSAPRLLLGISQQIFQSEEV